MRWWRLIIFFSLTGLALLLGIYWRRSEPRYHGRYLSYWIRGFESDVLESRWQSADAVRHIGTNAIPFLLPKLGHPQRGPEPEWRQKFRVLLSKQSVLKIYLPYPADERTEALAALDALGPAAKDAVPALEALLHERHPDHRAILVLGRLGPVAKPTLTRALTNETKLIRSSARICLDMLQTNSDILFPKTAADAEFIRKQCRFNLSLIGATVKDYRAQHPEEFPPYSVDEKPPSRLPPGFIQNHGIRTNLPPILTPRPSARFE